MGAKEGYRELNISSGGVEGGNLLRLELVKLTQAITSHLRVELSGLVLHPTELHLHDEPSAHVACVAASTTAAVTHRDVAVVEESDGGSCGYIDVGRRERDALGV